MVGHTMIEELEEWKQAADVEAGLRREFLARAEAAEEQRDALLRTLDAATQWQPIETAPKDGTHILASRVPIGIRVTNLTNPPTVVHWFDDPDEPGFYTSVNERAPEYPFHPTHWMPLPAPPSQSGDPK